MPGVTILTEDDLRSCVELDAEILGVVEDAFRALARGAAALPPALYAAIPAEHGRVDVTSACVPGLDGFAVRISPAYLHGAPPGTPGGNGLTVLLEPETGAARAVLLDNNYLADIAAAAAGALAAKHLAPHEVHAVGIIGAGLQAELQIRALKLVRDFSELVVWARAPGKAEAYAMQMRKALGVAVRVATTPREAAQHADVLVTATPAGMPIVERDWLHPGLHITATGSNTPDKNELDPRIVAEADRFVCDSSGQSRARGEMRAAIAAGLMPEDHVADELGEIVGGNVPGRQGEEEITVCDLTGGGAQDNAIAAHAVRIAVECGLGFEVEN